MSELKGSEPVKKRVVSKVQRKVKPPEIPVPSLRKPVNNHDGAFSDDSNTSKKNTTRKITHQIIQQDSDETPSLSSSSTDEEERRNLESYKRSKANVKATHRNNSDLSDPPINLQRANSSNLINVQFPENISRSNSNEQAAIVSSLDDPLVAKLPIPGPNPHPNMNSNSNTNSRSPPQSPRGDKSSSFPASSSSNPNSTANSTQNQNSTEPTRSKSGPSSTATSTAISATVKQSNSKDNLSNQSKSTDNASRPSINQSFFSNASQIIDPHIESSGALDFVDDEVYNPQPRFLIDDSQFSGSDDESVNLDSLRIDGFECAMPARIILDSFLTEAHQKYDVNVLLSRMRASK